MDSAGEHVYAWEADGSAVPGFPVRLDPVALAPRGPHARQPHQARLHRLAGARRPERGRRPRDRGRRRSTSTSTSGTATATRCPASRRSCATRRIPGAEIITTAALGDVNGDGKLDIVTPTQEFDDNPSAPETPGRRGRRLLGLPHQLPRQRARRQRPHLRGRPRRQRAAGLAHGAERDRARRAAVRRPRRGPRPRNVDTDPELEAIGNVASGDVTATNGDGSNAARSTTRSRRAASTSTRRRSSTCSRTRSPRTSTASAGPRSSRAA